MKKILHKGLIREEEDKRARARTYIYIHMRNRCHQGGERPVYENLRSRSHPYIRAGEKMEHEGVEIGKGDRRWIDDEIG